MQLFKQQVLKVTNSLSGKKEVFKSIKEGYIGMYVCGYGRGKHFGKQAQSIDVIQIGGLEEEARIQATDQISTFVLFARPISSL